MDREDRKFALLLGCSHFFVDFACTALLTLVSSVLPYTQVLACALIYNGMAFAFQLPIGALGDCFCLHRGLAAVGCVLVALGGFLPDPLALCAVIGLGNACFHAGGGREALKRGEGTAALVGRFVAPGAIGIFLGPKLGSLAWLTRGALSVCLAILALLLAITRKAGRRAESLALGPASLSRLRLLGIMACMFLTVLLRSYIGTVLRYSFLTELWLAAAFTLCIFAGKYTGGILGDRFGVLSFSAWAQLASTILFTLSPFLPLLALPAIFLFNTTMAITASQLYAALPRYPGTMFGLTTFALFLGVVPRLLGWPNLLFNWWGLGLISLVSTALLLGGLTLAKGGDAHGGTDCAVAAEIPGDDPGP